MRYNVIAISRTLGAGGEDLGESLADELGFRYVDTEILDRAAAVAGVSSEQIAQVEARKGLLSRIVAGLGRARTHKEAEGVPANPDGYEQLVIDVIKETASMQFVVIVAHGASIPLAGSPGLLRVLVTASPAQRVQRVAGAVRVPPSEARKMVEDSDHARAEFFRRFYQLDEETATHYDIVVNTDAVSIDEASAAILAVVRRDE
ncbi:MAG: AAA family ATPase [Dehalococcoidia bacterium]